MKREIKFRGWDIIENKMREVRDICFDQHGGMDVYFDCDGINDRGKSADILIQFTGLHDKNGKEIYDQDIFQYQQTSKLITKDFKGYVCSQDGAFGYKIVDDDYNVFTPFCEFDEPEEFFEQIEIIGNCFANPEFLKEQHENK